MGHFGWQSESLTLAQARPRAATLRAALGSGRFFGCGSIRDGRLLLAIPHRSMSLEPVIPDAGKILCVGLNYETHRKETGRSEVESDIFTRFANTQIGDGAAIVCPRVSKDLDFEGELAVIIGRPVAIFRARSDGACSGVCLLQRCVRAGLAAPHASIYAWQELSRHRPVRSLHGDPRRGRPLADCAS